MSGQTPAPTSRAAEAAIHGAAEVLYRDYASQYQADHLSWRDFADLAREALTAAGAIGAYDPNHEPGLSECGCRMCNPQPAPGVAAAIQDVIDRYPEREPQTAPAPELAAAMIETRHLRELVVDMLTAFTVTGSGHSARVGQVQIAKWRKRAGLPE